MSTTVGDLLRVKGPKVETIAPGATILEAIRRMADKHIGCLAVTNRTGRLVGIVSERDCLWKVIAAGRSPRTKLVKEVMTPVQKMRTVTPAILVDECMELMTGRRHRHLPVLVDGKLAGLVSIGDIVKFAIDAREATIQSLEKYITGSL
ncbi:MAG: CBS domain-containing protein [Kiritimatiellae bacterium]|jgi:CBS domain-containing protein|nr:CBS domain-containing protein [Kiritimatiellia bacterium]NLD89570.1 CBS domain-containing protein [Lentisphaerota bacterium]HOU21745.1 CBS domain-containing protein [Kiritimatiellia bacterium]HPC20452.1 CBS domain-containing protein [Kiritimatiellia bacterium]HQN80066.1 CBS domain-containing protein [Kiritimatiellia bacterium]